MARERLERSIQIEADVRTSGDQRLEIRGLGSEIYRDSKHGVKSVVKVTGRGVGGLCDVILELPWWYWLLMVLLPLLGGLLVTLLAV